MFRNRSSFSYGRWKVAISLYPLFKNSGQNLIAFITALEETKQLPKITLYV